MYAIPPANTGGGAYPVPLWSLRAFTRVRHSSAKNTLTGMSVAIKKALKPFSTAIHCKRTYRELALLKHMHHENVRSFEAAHATHRLVEG